MEKSQLKPGFTAIANEVMDNLARIRIPGEARQVLDFIIRQTLGWNHNSHPISLKGFSDGTGLSKVHIIQAIKRLISMNLVIVTEKGNDSLPNTVTPTKLYGFNKDFESWQPIAKKVPVITEKGNDSLPNTVTPITEKGNDSLPNTVTNVTEYGNAPAREPAPKATSQIPKNSKNSIKKKKSHNTFPPDAPAYRLSVLLFDKIIKINPLSTLKALDNNVREQKLQKWAVDTDRLIRLGKQEPSMIEQVINFAVYHDFWGINILSTGSLRRNYDRLVKEMQGKGKLPKQKQADPPESLDGKRFVVYGGMISIPEKRSARYVTPEEVIDKFKVDYSECLIESTRAPLRTKGVDVSKYIALRPPIDGVYDLDRAMQEHQGRACA